MSKILLEADVDNLEDKLIELTNDPELTKKILTLGEPLKKACKVLGYNINNKNGGNPILAFVLQDYVVTNLINPGLLNVNTFKSIYNAVAKQLVADSEFFKSNNYNIIYCENLYKKSPKEMEEYLTLQKNILNPSAEIYSTNDQLKNRKTFLYIRGVTNSSGEEELNVIKRANAIKKLTDPNKIPSVFKAKLNSIELTEKIYSPTSLEADPIDTDKLNKIIVKLNNLASKFATILLLCTKSPKAKPVLNHPKFMELSQKQIANAFIELSKDNTFPRSPLRKDDANLLIDAIIATLEPNGNQAGSHT